MKVINVRFHSTGYSNGSKSYAYYTDIEGIKVGDTVVIDAPSSGFTCVTVTSVDETLESIQNVTKWVVDKVDTEAYKDRISKQRKRQVLIAKLKKIKEKVLEEDQFRELARISPEASELVKQLNEL